MIIIFCSRSPVGFRIRQLAQRRFNMRTLFSVAFAVSFAARCAGTAAAPPERESNYSGELFTSDYFNVTDKPVLGNGHVAYVPFADSIYMNGLYNGNGDSTHRARIPNYANIYFERCGSPASDLNKLRCTYELDMQQAVFRSRADFEDGSFSAEHIQYAHRHFDAAIVSAFTLRRSPTHGPGTRVQIMSSPNRISANFGNHFRRFSARTEASIGRLE